MGSFQVARAHPQGIGGGIVEELKPCPFCGGEARINQYLDSLFWVRCFECGAEIQAFSTEEEAAKLWNTRANECDNDYCEVE